MAICVLFDFPDGTLEQYDEACSALNGGQPMRSLSDWPDGGCLAHAAWLTPEGLRVLDIWESTEKFSAFGDRLMPIVQEVGLKPNEPEIFPAHNYVTK